MPTYLGATDDVLTVDREIVDPKAVAFELKLELMSPWLDCAIDAGDDPEHCRRRTPGCDAVTRLEKRKKRVISMVMIRAHLERKIAASWTVILQVCGK